MNNPQNQDYQEINLADYIKIILKRKKLIFSIFVLAVLGAFVFSIFSPKIYKIDSSLELGQIEAPVQLVKKINNGVYNGKYGVGILASNPKNTKLVRLKIESEDYQKAKSALKEVNGLILKEHQEKIAIKKDLIRKDIEKIENKISLIQDDIVQTKNKKALIDSNISKIKNKIITNQDDIKRLYNKISSKEKEKGALQEKVSALEEQLIFEQTPGTQFALFSAKQELESKKQEIENLYLQINSLQRTIEDYNIQINNLESSKQDYNIKISSLRADKNNLALEINALNKSLQEIEPTKIIKQPIVSGPIKPRPMLNIAIAGVLGIFIAVFLAFAKEWWQAANLSSF